eukprot:TRINITY_DN1956_c0_g1_i1.p1 TRINITY_DN1956_c0_g1~~TRINITY_DN1956_c0_g1_i1.p1  ORF type:complete len:1052 (-),score=325.35 TRINITY_DN1956_c0_g1_i1:1636-4791(-)
MEGEHRRNSLPRGSRTFSVKNIASSINPPQPVDPQVIARTRTRALQQASRKIEDFTHVDWKTVCQDLAVDFEKGLSSEEAKIRLERQGPNELTKPKPTPLWKLFLEQFSDLLVLLLCFACIASMALQQYKSGVAILLVLIINASIGVYMEYKASGDLEALSQLAGEKAKVLRDGQILVVNGTDLVPGDIAVLETGDRVPADLRLIQSVDLSSDEAALTGESVEVKKDALFVEHISEESANTLQVVTETAETTTAPKTGTEEKKEEAHLSSKNMVFMGCTIQDGRGRGIVVKTGMATKMGHVASLLANTESGDTPLQQRLEQLGKYLGIASLAMSLVVFVVGAATDRGYDKTQNKWVQLVLIAVSLTVAAVPEGLPVAVTITLALGMRRMVGKGAYIKHLHSVETLGSASVICSDKTGTLTKGAMTAVRVWYDYRIWKVTGTGYDPTGEFVKISGGGDEEKSEGFPFKLVLIASSLSSNSRMQKNAEKGTWEVTGNSSEKPLVVAATKAGFDSEKLASQYPRVKENPFNSARKMMSVFVHNSQETAFPTQAKRLSIVKGAPNVVLDRCVSIVSFDGSVREISADDKNKILEQIDNFSESAFRVLAIAFRPFEHEPHDLNPDTLESNLTLIGLVASIDPEREEVIPSIDQCYNAGIRVVMITGDYVKTARAIAINIKLLPADAPAEASIDCEVIREWGDELAEIKNQRKNANNAEKKELDEREKALQEKVDAVTNTADVYARAKPVDKITIVESLQRQGNVCSMTGDGVNDAPALKQANIGVAMGITGTATAKGAADMILTNDDFCSIVKAVEEGRTIYTNITKFVFYLLSCNIAEVLFVLISVLIGYETPLSPIQILYLNLTTDVAPALALAVEATEPGTMEEGPRKSDEPLLSKLMIVGIVIQTIVLTLLCVFGYMLGLYFYVGTIQVKDSYANFTAEVQQAQTISLLLIVFSELLRALSSRSLRESMFAVGFFSNRYMIYSVFGSMILTVIVYFIPGVNSFFGLYYIDSNGWAVVMIGMLIPLIVEEITKIFYRQFRFGERQKTVRYSRK